ncbi:hypothetical protein ENH_00045770 [Eimeria necatrix]|uniref:Uncharacterized protein n=1 Tax=Eimeria necatrix TaxID=51315 RepID=U6MHX2_9EIME|nr:hypothetical protein ENH_00045770 [Eimeria necatrix]CDJ63606.1 hypothetical protein ENH_00045770 [Eimeria necatrix]
MDFGLQVQSVHLSQTSPGTIRSNDADQLFTTVMAPQAQRVTINISTEHPTPAARDKECALVHIKRKVPKGIQVGMDTHLRNGKEVQPPPEPNGGMPNVVVSSKETAGHPIESKRTEPGSDIARVGRPMPRNQDRDVGGRKEPEMNRVWMKPEMAEFFRRLAFQVARGIVEEAQRPIEYEDGKNMRDFLDLVELDFTERGLEQRQWGEQLKRYLTGDALGYWLYLRRSGVPLTDWEELRQRFCAQFCISLERMKVMIAKNVWRGDHRAYSARFADIVAQGVSVAPDLLVGYYLANLPDEILREITQGGTRKFADWQEAAAALATTVAPWKDLCEDRLRFQRDLEDAKRRWTKGGREPGPLRARESRENRWNDAADLRCYACSGRGHVGRDCPLRSGATRRPGETCSRCGGWDHYARDCPTPARLRAEPARQRRPQPTRPNVDPVGPSHGRVEPLREMTVLGGLVEVADSQCEALLDTGASRSFIGPGAVERLQLKARKLPEECVLANGAHLRIDRVVKGLTMRFGATRLAGDFLVGPVPYDLVRTLAEQAYDILAKQVADMTREEATALLRPPSKRYKPPSKGKRKAVVAAPIQQAPESAACIRHQLLIPSRRWSHVNLDFVTDLRLTTTGHDAILVVVDSLSKMAHFIPAKKSHSAADTVELLAARLIRYHGFPDVLISDRDPRFQSEADEREWEGLLPALELAYNTASHSSTELSPFEIMSGENPLTAADLDIVAALAPPLTPPYDETFPAALRSCTEPHPPGKVASEILR